MSNLMIENSNFIVYVLQRENEATLEMNREPKGWNDDDLQIVRNKKYHGILTQFTGALSFYGREKEFIESAYKLRGTNANLYLTRYKLRKGKSYVVGDDVDDVKFRIQYRGLADYKTKTEKDGGLQLNFNTQELDRTLESFHSDDIPIGRYTDLDNNTISNFPRNKTIIKGRDLQGIGLSKNYEDYIEAVTAFAWDNALLSIPTEFGIKGFARNVEVTNKVFPQGSSLGHQANFFYNDIDDSVILETKLEVSLKFAVKIDVFRKVGDNPIIYPTLRRYEFNEETSEYDFIQEDWSGTPFGVQEWTSFEGVIKNYDYGVLKNTTGLAIAFYVTNYEPPPQNVSFQAQCWIQDYEIRTKETNRYNPDEKTHSFSFINEVGSRLTEIITGKKNKFYSKVFGRAGDLSSNQYQDYAYEETGEWGNIGLIHGFDIRQFKQNNPLYKSMEISLKKIMDSMIDTFNIGVSVEESALGQRLRFEKITHFYRNRTVVKLPIQVSNVERSLDEKMFNSSGSFGNSKSGDYEFGLGLDEPNAKTDYLFPLKKTSNKYLANPQVRSDETGMEIIRREPEYLDPTKDMGGDSDIWFLDLKKRMDGLYEQLEWNDALTSLPTGIVSPETFRAWRFSPKRTMFRHGNIIRAGMEHDLILDKYITLGASTSNVNLETEYLPGVAPSEKLGVVSESRPEKAGRLDNALMLPDIIKCKHPVDDDLMDWIMGTTPVIYGGEVEEIPNWYFKMEIINEKEEPESVYLISMMPKSGQFEFYKANEEYKGVIEEPDDELCFSTEAYFLKTIVFKVGGTGYIRWNDGTPDTFYNGNEVEITKIGNNFSGVIDFYGTLTALLISNTDANFTHDIGTLPDEMRVYDNQTTNLCYGNIAQLPRFIQVFKISGWNVVEGDVSTLPSGLLQISLSGFNTVTGNISQAPNIHEVTIWTISGKNTVSEYTSGTVFHAEIYFFIHKPESGSGLSSSEVDNILIDLYNSGMGSGIIDLKGSNSPRTSLSDSAKTGLEARGVIVQTN